MRADLRGGRPRGGLSAARSPGRRFDVVTFDCYGTLIDWEGGIGDWFETAAARSGITLDRRRALDLYASIEPVVEAESYRPYRDVLAETARRVAEQMSWPLSEQEAKGLAASLPDWSPFPDTNPALRRIAAAGYRFGILSNVDDDLLAGTRRHLEVAFDILITAEQVRSYKPAHGHFEEARRQIGPLRWLHAAQSRFHDVAPCRELGIPVAWINRLSEPARPDILPDVEVRTLADLASRFA
ncbi:MAG TPA: HAD-IA family hydrolase [Thermoanaerobaculia bacterium]|nr:HAD-IA family hydrolase [Thermoanaerobaculia bacterium]